MNVKRIAGIAIAGAICVSFSHATIAADRAAVLEAVSDLYGVSESQAVERLAREAEAMRIYGPLKDFLGDAYAGAWIDGESGGLVVAVTDPGVSKWIKVAGGEPVQVSQSLAELQNMRERMTGLIALHLNLSNHTYSSSINAQANSIEIHSEPTRADRIREILRIAGWNKNEVRVIEKTSSPELLAYTARGAQAFTNIDEGYNCSVGFSLVEGGYATAGHCGWYTHAVNGWNGMAQGNFVQSTWPPYATGDQEDFAWVSTNSSWFVKPEAWGYQDGLLDLYGTTEAPLNSTVCRYGLTTEGPHCGQVLEKDVTFHNVRVYPFGWKDIDRLYKTSACSEPGDSGGPFIDAATLQNAQGLASARDGGSASDCPNDGPSAGQGETFYAPTHRILSGLQVTFLSSATSSNITDFVCPDNANSGGGTYFCSVSYNSQDPTLVQWSSSTGHSSHSGGLFGSCLSGTTVTVDVTVSNAYGQDTRSTSFSCPTGPLP